MRTRARPRSSTLELDHVVVHGRCDGAWAAPLERAGWRLDDGSAPPWPPRRGPGEPGCAWIVVTFVG